jgi:hypothetical protein
MRGGFAGGDHDPKDDGIRESIIIRQDSVIEFYSSDTLAWSSPFQVVHSMGERNLKQTIELKMVGRLFEGSDFSIIVQDENHLSCGQGKVVDGFNFLFTRFR